jgi:DNA-binding response OmpR family regulator
LPALENAVAGINLGVDAYLIKPVDTIRLLRFIKEQLEKQKQGRKYVQQKSAKFVETRIKELQSEELETPKAKLAKE